MVAGTSLWDVSVGGSDSNPITHNGWTGLDRLEVNLPRHIQGEPNDIENKNKSFLPHLHNTLNCPSGAAVAFRVSHSVGSGRRIGWLDPLYGFVGLDRDRGYRG